MKRSEMIQEILNNIIDTDWIQYGEFKKGAEQILDAIEEAGMLPPAVGIGEEDDFGHLQYENEWEPENEV